MSMLSRLFVMACAIAGSFGSTAVRADAVSIVNPSFDYLTSNGILNQPGWTHGAGPSVGFNAYPFGVSGTASLEGWAAYQVSTQTVSFSSAGAQYLDETHWIAGNYSGVDNATGITNEDRVMAQSVGGALAPHTTYVLTATMYQRDGLTFPIPGNLIFELRDGSMNVLPGGTAHFVLPTVGAPGTATFTVATGDVAPGDLILLLGNASTTSAQVNWDDVSLTATPIPEPSGAAMCGLAACFLFGMRKRGAA